MTALLAASVYVGWLIWTGFRRNPGINTWHMFAELHMVEFHLLDSAGQPLDVYAHLPHTHLSMSLNEARFFLKYLAVFKGEVYNGTLVSRQGSVTKTFKVESSRVLDFQ